MFSYYASRTKRNEFFFLTMRFHFAIFGSHIFADPLFSIETIYIYLLLLFLLLLFCVWLRRGKNVRNNRTKNM